MRDGSTIRSLQYDGISTQELLSLMEIEQCNYIHGYEAACFQSRVHVYSLTFLIDAFGTTESLLDGGSRSLQQDVN